MKFKQLYWLIYFIIMNGCNFESPKSASQLNKIGLKFSTQGNKKEAIKYFFKAANKPEISDEDRTIYFQNIAGEYWNVNIDSAKYYYSQAVRLNKRNSYSWLYNMANLYILNKHVGSAIYSLNKAFFLDSTTMLVNNLQGLIYLGTYGEEYDDPIKALKYNVNAYNIANDINTESVLAQNYYLIGEIDKAVDLYKDVCNQMPDFYSYKSTLAMIYLELGKTKNADTLLNELKENDSVRYNKIIHSNIKKGEHTLTWNN